MRLPSSPHVSSWTAAALALSLLAACAKKPSPEYDDAANRFSELYRQKWDQAFVDPAMDEIEAKLKSVPKDSLDAQAAQGLLLRIQENRKRVQAEEAGRAQRLSEATRPPVGDTGSGGEFRAELPVADQGSPVTDAGPPAAALPVVGMKFSDFRRDFGDCFRDTESLNVMGKGRLPTWGLRDLPSCRDKYPVLVPALMVFDEEKLYAILDKNLLDRRFPDGGKPSAEPER